MYKICVNFLPFLSFPEAPKYVKNCDSAYANYYKEITYIVVPWTKK